MVTAGFNCGAENGFPPTLNIEQCLHPMTDQGTDALGVLVLIVIPFFMAIVIVAFLQIAMMSAVHKKELKNKKQETPNNP